MSQEPGDHVSGLLSEELIRDAGCGNTRAPGGYDSSLRSAKWKLGVFLVEFL